MDDISITAQSGPRINFIEGLKQILVLWRTHVSNPRSLHNRVLDSLSRSGPRFSDDDLFRYFRMRTIS